MASISFSIAVFLAITLFLTLEVSTIVATETNERETRLHFFMQEKTKFPNATMIKVVSSSITKNDQSNSFGDLFVFDHSITEGRDPSSRLLGRVQGTTTITSLHGDAGLITLNLVFTDLYPWKGSSLTLIGGFSSQKETIELQVVGGTGGFRSAQGFGVSRALPAYVPDIFTFEVEVVAFNN